MSAPALPMPTLAPDLDWAVHHSGAQLRAAAAKAGGTLRADLVMEGGGVKGIALAGAVATLSGASFTFPRVAGTSAGAIAAVLVAALQCAGRPASDLVGYLATIDYSRFVKESELRKLTGKVGDATHLLLHMGLYDGDYLLTWLGGILDDLGVTTFGDLRISPGADPGSSLAPSHQYTAVVHTSDITRRLLVRLPWDYPRYGLDPDKQKLVDAVRASMSIPFFFEPVRTTSYPNTTDGQAWLGGAVTWVDGGMLSNFPIGVFDREDGAKPRFPTIGIKLSARTSVMGPDAPANDVLGEATDCLHTMLNEWDRYHLDDTTAKETVFVDTGTVSSTDFHVTVDQQRTLFLRGEEAAAQYLIDCGPRVAAENTWAP